MMDFLIFLCLHVSKFCNANSYNSLLKALTNQGKTHIPTGSASQTSKQMQAPRTHTHCSINLRPFRIQTVKSRLHLFRDTLTPPSCSKPHQLLNYTDSIHLLLRRESQFLLTFLLEIPTFLSKCRQEGGNFPFSTSLSLWVTALQFFSSFQITSRTCTNIVVLWSNKNWQERFCFQPRFQSFPNALSLTS